MTGSAVVSGGTTHGFTECKTTINGLVAAHWVSPSGEPALHHIDQEVMFDSTRFANWSLVDVVFSALGDDGVWYHSPAATVQIRNQATVFGRYDLDVEPLTYRPQDPSTGEYEFGDSTWAGSPHASALLQLIGYDIWQGGAVNNLGWSWTQLSAGIEASSVIYINTHGGSLLQHVYFETDRNDHHFYYPAIPPDLETDAEYVFGVLSQPLPQFFEVLPHRVAANGTGLPPFNTNVPPVTLAWVDGCKAGYQDTSGGVNTFPEAFLYPGGNFYVPINDFPENQAFCGYLFDVDIPKTEAVVKAFFRYLKSGYTVTRARELAYKIYNPAYDRVEWEKQAHEWLAVYGDFATKLKGVYRGDTETTFGDTTWSRVL